MNLNELLIGNIAADQQTFALTRSSRTSAGSGQTLAFSQVLDSRMSNAAGRVRQSSISAVQDRSAKDAGTQSSNETRYESYRKLVSGNSSEKVNAAGRRKAAVQAEGTDRSEENDTAKSKNEMKKRSYMLEILAQMLGADSADLERILAENGVNTDALSNPGNIEEAAAVLSGAFGLDDGQTSTLIKLMQLIGEMAADNGAVPFNIQLSEGNEAGETAITDMDNKSVANDGISGQLREIIKEKLDELSARLENQEAAVIDEIRQTFLSMQQKTDLLKQSFVKPDLTEGLDSEDVAADAANEVLAAKVEEATVENEESSVKVLNEDNQQSSVMQADPDGNGVQPVAVFSISANDAAGTTSAVSFDKAEAQPIPTREIISQIVEKASVILADDKTEMIMELKPESLGRISLKVVTENGIVMAKFVAENRQVQQVLETNMQMLKDSLERQGINVQSLSVSVRQDGGQEGENQPQYAGWRQMRDSRGISRVQLNGIGGIIGGLSGELTARNPYMWDDSTINITA